MPDYPAEPLAPDGYFAVAVCAIPRMIHKRQSLSENPDQFLHKAPPVVFSLHLRFSSYLFLQIKNRSGMERFHMLCTVSLYHENADMSGRLDFKTGSINRSPNFGILILLYLSFKCCHNTIKTYQS